MAGILFFQDEVDNTVEDQDQIPRFPTWHRTSPNSGNFLSVDDGISLRADDDDDDKSGNLDDCLPPVASLEKYAESENMFNRKMVVRNVLETLRAVSDSSEDVNAVLAVVNTLAHDGEPSVRAELMEQIPHIAVFCHESRSNLEGIVSSHLLPLVVNFLTDMDNQVRKTSQAALLVLMEQGLVPAASVESQVTPVIIQLTEPESNEEYRTGAVALMSKMVPLVGREATERMFLQRFAALCLDSVIYVRKVCAANFGEFCAVVGPESTEKVLLPQFLLLCEDEIWGVRKACAEVFMSVSWACSLMTRKRLLAPAFVSLLRDSSKWVQMASFQALGPFISTFADPQATGLAYNQQGELVLLCESRQKLKTGDNGNMQDSVRCCKEACEFPVHGADNCYSSSETAKRECINADLPNQASAQELINSHLSVISSECDNSEKDSSYTQIDIPVTKESLLDDYRKVHSDSVFSMLDATELKHMMENLGKKPSEEFRDCKGSERCTTADPRGTSHLSVTETSGHLHIHVDNESQYNNFNFWRLPIPDLELDIDIVEGRATNIQVKAKVHGEDERTTYASELNVNVDHSNQAIGCKDGNGVESALANLAAQLETSLPNEPQATGVNDESGSAIQVCNQASRAHVYVASLATVSDGDGGATRVLGSSISQSSMTFADGAVKDMQRSRVELISPDLESKLLPGTGTEGGDAKAPMAGMFRPKMRLHNQRIGNPYDLHDLNSEDVSQKFVSYNMQTDSQFPQKLHSYSLCQDIVPQLLIDHFVSMTDPSQAQSVDNEIAHHCAFSLPAVALTLGRTHWRLLRETCEALASDMQWKVRRTLASSIHELAVILGEDLTTKDLVPIYHGFIKDIDEVRIGALKHLGEFLKLLPPAEREGYLPRLAEFLSMDNERNWRFRLELADQLVQVIPLFYPADVRKHLVPLGVALLMDKVAAVRQTALALMSHTVLHLRGDAALTRSVLAKLADRFAHSDHWNRRQTFALLCCQIVANSALNDADFACDLLPHLLDLSWDSVPNVRLAVARGLSRYILPKDYFVNEGSPHFEVLAQVISRLQLDKDQDVRYFASLSIPENTSTALEIVYLSFRHLQCENIW